MRYAVKVYEFNEGLLGREVFEVLDVEAFNITYLGQNPGEEPKLFDFEINGEQLELGI
jgi:hypothetical protein